MAHLRNSRKAMVIEGRERMGKNELQPQREGSHGSRGAFLTILKMLTFIARAIGSH